MHTVLVISAYMAMILVPCACAQWGDYLTLDWWSLKLHYRRTAHLSDGLLIAIRETRLAAEQAAEISALSGAAFTHELRAPRFRPVRRRRIGFAPRLDTATQAQLTQHLTERIKNRLMALSESFRLSNSTTEQLIAAYATPPPAQASTALRKPPIRSLPLLEATHVRGTITNSQLIYAATPSAEELDNLYGIEQPVNQEQTQAA